MSTQDFVSPKRIDTPRHEQNMPEGVDTPVPQAWIGNRPGDDLLQKKDNELLLGNPGPNIGYALKIVNNEFDTLYLVEHENEHDVVALLAEIAMRRASVFGRAPVKADVVLAAHILSYDVEPTQGEEKWRPQLIHNCSHDEHRRRQIVNSVPQMIIKGENHGHDAISGWWEKLEDLF